VGRLSYNTTHHSTHNFGELWPISTKLTFFWNKNSGAFQRHRDCSNWSKGLVTSGHTDWKLPGEGSVTFGAMTPRARGRSVRSWHTPIIIHNLNDPRPPGTTPRHMSMTGLSVDELLLTSLNQRLPAAIRSPASLLAYAATPVAPCGRGRVSAWHSHF